MAQITILINNIASEGYCSEHGLSLFIQTEDSEILFDAGSSDQFIQNAQKLDISLDSTIKVLSHGHWDHGNGFHHIQGGIFYAHPRIFTRRYRDRDNSYIGMKVTREELEHHFDLRLSKTPQWIDKKTLFIGEIPRDGEQNTAFHLEDNKPDYIIDDSGLILIEENDVHIITGCNHAGLINIIEYTKTLFPNKHIKSIIGGLHLKEVNDLFKATLSYLKDIPNLTIYPLHCTSEIAMIEMQSNISTNLYKAGDSFVV
ncbi:MBL fold metallo-hydrolase [Halosquirtibacter laminarini]|uniref:MBL fold metallo-hydrolase n=1 Tax=Halosquirtibacter laminarini TaxID=3374600 RepID=A0AC61NJW0_9BACT|nr:MBL fold metallo-hydrolase [Prolixibacteraceae bacterium]